MEKNKQSLYLKIIRPILVRVYYRIRAMIWMGYYRFHFIGWMVTYFRDTLLHRKNMKAIRELKKLINQAKNNGIPVFVQFPVVPWGIKLFQRPQQLAIAMNRNGYLVIYIEPGYHSKGEITRIESNLYLTDQREILPYLSGAIVSVYCNYPLHGFDKYLTDDFFANNSVFYEYVDHFNEQIIAAAHAEAVKNRFQNIKNQQICFMLATAQSLYEELQHNFPNKRILYLPNAVDVDHYISNSKIPARHIKLPARLQNAIKEKRKIIGYFGAIAPWIWDELILELAENRPEYCLLLIGPLYGDRDTIPTKENIISTGAVDYKDLPLYANYFDVSIIPFRLGEIARSTSPLKLFEYFAIGKPVIVTSDLVECIKFDGVFSASTPEEFIKKIDEAIEHSNNPELKQKYQRYAEENSWTMRAKKLHQLLIKK